MKRTIYFAADHAGFELKNELMQFVQHELGYEVVDCGAFVYNEQDDFTDFVSKAAQKVSAHPIDSYAIVLGGSGQGEAMIANRFPNVRATVYYGGDAEIIRLSKLHNNANVLSLGARFVDIKKAKEMVLLWLETTYISKEKYTRRNEEIDVLSQSIIMPNTKKSIYELVPSIPAHSFKEIERLAKKLSGTTFSLQVDLVDGLFVKNVSWPFTELNVVQELLKLKEIAQTYELEIDCMCMHPQQYLDAFVELGVKRVIIHVGTTENYEVCVSHAKTHGYKIGLGILNTTKRELVATLINQFEYVQVMGITEIGVQGQPFDQATLETIAFIRQTYPKHEIAVDGAVNDKTIVQLKKAGAVRFAPGSFITKAEDPKREYKQLLDMIGE